MTMKGVVNNANVDEASVFWTKCPAPKVAANKPDGGMININKISGFRIGEATCVILRRNHKDAGGSHPIPGPIGNLIWKFLPNIVSRKTMHISLQGFLTRTQHRLPYPICWTRLKYHMQWRRSLL